IVGNMMITVPVFADEDNDDVQYEEGDVQTEEAPEPEPEPEPAPEPEPEPEPEPAPAPEPTPEPEPAPAPTPAAVHMLTTDKPKISFGTKSSSDGLEPKTFFITNAGNEAVNLKWSQVNTSNAFKLNILGDINQAIAPNQSLQCSISVKEGLSPDDYSTTICFQNVNDLNSQVTVTASIKIENASPKVTGISITPGSASASPGSTIAFSTSVKGENNPDTSVSWAVRGAGSSGTDISNDGVLKIGKDETSNNIVVVASSKADPEYQAKADVDISYDKFTLTVNTSPSKGGRAAGGGSFKSGETPTITAVPNNGYDFIGWVKNGGDDIVSYYNNYTVDKITGNVNYTAIFEKASCYVEVYSEHERRGSVKGGGLVDYGKDVTIKASPKNSCAFKGWYEDGKKISDKAEYTIKNVKRDYKLMAVFKSSDYTVNVSAYPKDGGKVSGGGDYLEGDDVTLKAEKAKGYNFKGWSINNKIVSTSDKYKIKDLDRDISVTAVFEKDGVKTYTINSGLANKGGVISPSGKLTVEEGGVVTYIITPDNGYKIYAVAVDGKQVGPVNTYTFSSIKGNHEIAVAFAPKENSVKPVKMDKIISTEEARAIAVAQLQEGGSEAGTSDVVTAPGQTTASSESKIKIDPQEAKKAAAASTEESIDSEETIIISTEDQNLVGMDNTEEIVEEVEYNYDTAGGFFQDMDITPEEAEAIIDSGDDKELMQAAYENGYISVTVNNQYGKKVVDLSEDEDSRVSLFGQNTSVTNLPEVVSSLFTKEEKMRMLNGEDTGLNFNIVDAPAVTKEDEKVSNQADGAVPVKYLDVVLIKTTNGVPQVVHEIPVEMEIVLEIPDDVKEKLGDKDACVIRVHDGEAAVLEDLDSDPDTITVRTDRFSSYSFAAVGSNGPGIVKIIIFTVVGLIIIGILAFLVMLFVNNNRRKQRRRRKQL
ncbi:MAG: InlB B-repeat-containing protein, partial [Lachnospiraceae bacterium]|nr:InlB B-repeat-containing protein [Lachnospiraceae bacterium]